MKELAHKVAVVTGAASGIGLALATRFSQEGMKVVLADIEAAPLEGARAALAARGAAAIAVRTDVSREEDVKRLADVAFEGFGNVHVLCNNAGVSGGFGADGVWNVARQDWEWVLGVNFSGVLYGIRQFVPRMLAQGEAGHIVNTASVAGLVTSGTGAPYTVSKHAVVALTELLYKDLKARNAQLSASVLCPGWVDTKIIESARNRPQELNTGGAAQATPEQLLRLAAVRGFLKSGFQPGAIADLVLEAIRSDAFYVVPVQPDIGNALATRLEDIRLRRNPTLA
ncbi:MAG TPA: SDR family NAD(P)-dependent oxidoreductase [Burkholderiales bacterium]|nr:SDR family NAD(P)-dependent oxidoreductase [Burkholderiales bacterium]